MKATKKQNEFNPFTIEIEIESEKEAQALYALFDVEAISKFFGHHVDDISIRKAISDKYYLPYLPCMLFEYLRGESDKRFE